MASKEQKQELWVGWTRDAISKFEPTVDQDGDIDVEETIDEMVDLAVGYADEMLKSYEELFEGEGKRKKKRKRRKPDPDDDDDDPDDD